MKEIKFYSFVAVQAVILFVFVGQYYLIDIYGDSFKVYVDAPYEYDFESYSSDIYVEYSMTEITKSKWGIHEELSYNDRVYVMLEKNDQDIYEVKDVADHKLTAYNDEQVVLRAFYDYDYLGKYHIDYRLQPVIDKKYFDHVDSKQPMIAHFKRAPWGQLKLIAIENISK